MSTLSYHQDRYESVINGPRPSPLKINKHSNVIQKASLHHPKLPVIIYEHSPKIIHTQPTDFMALVQKLTGFMPKNGDAPNDRDVNESSSNQNSNLEKNLIVSDIRHEKKESSLDVAEEKFNENGDAREASSSVPPPTQSSRNRALLNDFPLYTPTYYSADHILRYSDMVFQSPNMCNMLMLSPSFLEAMTDLPQY